MWSSVWLRWLRGRMSRGAVCRVVQPMGRFGVPGWWVLGCRRDSKWFVCGGVTSMVRHASLPVRLSSNSHLSPKCCMTGHQRDMIC